MKHYDPKVAPIPTEWLELDEQERIQLVETHHTAARIKLPNAKMHALIHVIVENQIAEELESTVRAIARLMTQGLSRHDALHAIGTVVAEHLFEIMGSKANSDTSVSEHYNSAVEKLTAKE